MDLNWVKLTGYKRLECEILSTPGKVVAIVGANEAGKSSILGALAHLNHKRPFLDDELTRGKEFQDSDVILEFGFFLDDSDRAAISNFYQSEKVRQFKIKKLKNGQIQYEIVPEIQRDPNPTISIKETLELLLSQIATNKADISDKKLSIFMALANSIILAINTGKTNQETLKKMESIDFTLIPESRREELKENIDSLRHKIRHFSDFMKAPEPNNEAKEILSRLIPKILLFDEKQRNLSSSYDLSTLAENPRPALQNLADIASLNLVELRNYLKDNKQDKAKTVLNKANAKIASVFEHKWSQASIKVSLDTDGQLLYIYINDSQGYSTYLTERSDGLRQFVALLTFLEAANVKQKPILLVDEAETHLHYDAQADLMDMFTKQNLASKIIYTTHSAGCLPEDLGNGVRSILPCEEPDRSKIKNWFWADKRPGFSPLLFGMGASSLAFIPIRKAVFVEGATEMILLPTVFRQVIGRQYLGFQIIPGLSMIANSGLSLLENQAPGVVFLTDNDCAGRKRSQQLKEAGIDECRIFQLSSEDNFVLEDCIREELYLEALKTESQNWNPNADISLISFEDLPHLNRVREIEKRFKGKDVRIPEKRNVAYRLLDFATGEREEALVEPHLVQSLKELYNKIALQLGIEGV